MIRLSRMSISRGIAILVQYHSVEVKAMLNPIGRQAISPLEEWCFRYELAILLDERQQKLAVDSMGDFALQDTEYICNEIAKRLQTNHGLYPDNQQIKDYLDNVSKVMGRLDKLGETVSALDYVPKVKKNKGGRPKKLYKRGKRRPISINGVPYESVAAAEREKKLGYDFLRKTTLKEIKRYENSV